jgi:exopolysaccharide biosynthesis polyprenyl glycosylphosphotransferase
MSTYDNIEWSAKSRPRVRRRRLYLPTLGLRVSERKLLLIVVDVLLINGALAASLLLRTNLLPDAAALAGGAKWFVTVTAVWLLVAVTFDAYSLARAASTSYSAGAVAGAACLAAIVYMAIPWLTPPLENRSQGYLFVTLATLLLPLWRGLYAQLFVQPAFHRRALVVGAGRSGLALATALGSDYARRDANPFRGTGYDLVGFVDDDPVSQGTEVGGLPVLGGGQELLRLIRLHEVDEVIAAISDSYSIAPELYEAILDCRELGIPVTNMVTVYERLTGRVAVEYAGRNIELATGALDNPFARLHLAAKRLLDLAGAAVGLLALLCVIPSLALVNRLLAPGPLFFRQQRVGQGGRPFAVIKFRSMQPDAEKKSGAVWAAAGDRRVTCIGRWLRRTHLDELPQVINVLRGEMSLVGPRPERPEFVGELSRQIPFYRARHSLRPGITGWAQIHQDYGDSAEGALEKLEYDLYYAKHATPLLDLNILLRTVSKVLGLRGR